jgi:Insertion element 4 transposase N-terminal
MAELLRDLEQLADWPSDERLRALERIIPRRVVQEVLEQTGHARRRCRLLPHWFVVWLVIGLGLFANDSHAQIFKRFQRFRRGKTPRRSTLGEARKALGVAPMRLLAGRVVRLLATPQTPGAFYKGLRLMATDGFVLDLPDSPANARVFGKPPSGRAEGAFPQARVLALCEIGTHVLYRWLVKPIGTGAVRMAPYVLRWLEELAIDELKTHQKERPLLRSQTPAGVVQEVEGLLLAHYAVRTLMFEAAGQQGLDPRRLSFTGTLKVLRCRLPEVPKDPTDLAAQRRWWQDLLAEVGEEVLPPRRHRINPRVIKRKMSKWPKKRPHHRRPPQPTKPFRESIAIT